MSSLTEAYRAALEAGVPQEAIRAYVRDVCGVVYALENVAEAYQGEWASVEDYAEDFMESTGMLDSMTDNLRPYFDMAAFARDLELGGDITTCSTPDRYVFIFNNHI